MAQRPLAIFLMGPTASGKTDLAMELATRLPCDLISVDSAMIYRGMDIGTAKPDAATLQRFPHQLVDIRDPEQAYSAAEFQQDALACMAESAARGRIPLLVGGTMLYFRTLEQGLATLPGADAEVRQVLEAWAQAEGLAALHQELSRVDPEAAARIHPNDSQRLVRALEVFRVTGQTLSAFHHEQQQRDANDPAAAEALPYTVVRLAMAPEARSVLHARIEQRFAQMLQQGLVDEVEQLRRRPGLHGGLPSMRAVGYRQVWQFLDGQCSHDEMIQRGQAATRQLAKRQLTWLRGWDGVHWLDSLSRDNLSRALHHLSPPAILC